MLKNYLIPTRLLRITLYTDQIKDISKSYLPTPYNSQELLIKERISARFSSKSRFSKTPPKIDFGNNVLNLYSEKSVLFAGAEAAALYGYTVFQNYASVDDYVYETMERLSNQQMDSIADLSRKITEYRHDFWSGLTDGGLNKIGGHMGEIYAADHLEKFGTDIQWPDASNQAGWDLLINGHEVNVKLVADFSQLSQHFSKYPDIPVLIPGDTSNIPASAYHIDVASSTDDLMNVLSSHSNHLVIVDDALSHASIMEHAKQATDTLLGSTDAIQFHLPMMTVLLSGWREVELLTRSQTEVGSALKNLGLDVAGTATGGFLGAKIGAAIGTLVFPGIGTAIGSVLFGIGGSMLGRDMTNKIKREPFERAYASYQTINAEWTNICEAESKQFIIDYQQIQKEQQKDIKVYSWIEKESITKSIRMLKERRKQHLEVDVILANDILMAASLEITSLQNKIRTQMKQQSWIKRTFNPTIEHLGLERADGELRKAQRTLKRYRVRIQDEGTVSRSELYTILGGYGILFDQIENEVRAIESNIALEEKEVREKINRSMERIVYERAESLKKIGERVNEFIMEARQRLAPHLEKVTRSAEQVKIEAQKLGL